jgi:hypothetical protein
MINIQKLKKWCSENENFSVKEVINQFPNESPRGLRNKLNELVKESFLFSIDLKNQRRGKPLKIYSSKPFKNDNPEELVTINKAIKLLVDPNQENIKKAIKILLDLL